MKHLIISREFPPAPSGGIGRYVHHISRLLAESGENVHVIGQLWEGAEKPVEEHCRGKLVVHRIPFEDWRPFLRPRRSPLIGSKTARDLFASEFPAQCFSWQASILAERLVHEEGIDVIEAQDYEAPLFYFQFRRALNLGPKRRPPCIVHLHSPTEFVARYNDWDVRRPSWEAAKRMENYSILTADKLLCPSLFFAREAEKHYRLSEGVIDTIPYPLGEAPQIDRDPDVWSQGSISYVGRLERRKGILEWLHAAAAVSKKHPSVRFEFAGANVLCANRILSEELIGRMVPRAAKRQFTFHGEMERSALPGFLAKARLVVVPSRWDNFPNACMEAMQSGVPVIATREGGMVEMIEDRRTGWLAKEATAEALQDVLLRALETPAEEIAEMGRQAARRIAEFCNPQQIVSRHLIFRSRLIEQGARRYLLPSAESRPNDRPSAASVSTLAVADDAQALREFPQWIADDAAQVAGLKPQTGIHSAGPSFSTIEEPLATAKCLVRNPKLAMRIFRQVAAHLMRSGRSVV